MSTFKSHIMDHLEEVDQEGKRQSSVSCNTHIDLQALKSQLRKQIKVKLYGRTHKGPRKRRKPKERSSRSSTSANTSLARDEHIQKGRIDFIEEHSDRARPRESEMVASNAHPQIVEGYSRLPLVNAEDTASTAAFSVLDSEFHQRMDKGKRLNNDKYTTFNPIPFTDYENPEMLEIIVQDLAKALPDPEKFAREGFESKEHVNRTRLRSNKGESLDEAKRHRSRRTSNGTDVSIKELSIKTKFSNDPSRDARVALVVRMAEEERQRRINEDIEFDLQSRLERARRIEWAVKAIEEERERRAKMSVIDAVDFGLNQYASEIDKVPAFNLSKQKDRKLGQYTNIELTEEQFSEGKAPLQVGDRARNKTAKKFNLKVENCVYREDYEVICPYSSLGCDTTCLRSELPAHFAHCSARLQLEDYDDKVPYNPLNYIVACPYRIVGCDFLCKRMDLPEHLLTCPARIPDESSNELYPTELETYEVICPYSMMGCTYTCARAEVSSHLLECACRPITRQEEEIERAQNKILAIKAAEVERRRRMDQKTVKNPQSAKTRELVNAVLEAVGTYNHVSKVDESSPGSRLGKRRVEWLVRAAEIEIMRQKLEQQILISNKSIDSSNASVTSTKSETLAVSPLWKSKGLRNPSYSENNLIDLVISQQRPKSLPDVDESSEFSDNEMLNFNSDESVHSKDLSCLEEEDTKSVPEKIRQPPAPHANPFQDHLEKQTYKLNQILSEEIQKYSQKCARLCKSKSSEIEQIVSRLSAAAKKSFSVDMCVNVFGSYATGLAVPTLSDLDVVITTKYSSNRQKPSSSPSALIKTIENIDAALKCNILGRTLKHEDWVKSVKIIDRAHIPVVKISTESLHVDLTFSLPMHGGLKTVAFVKELIQAYPALVPLALSLKTFLFRSNLGDPFRGGLSSYALVLMIVTSLRRSYERNNCKTTHCLGSLLVDFLELFGRDFNYKTSAILSRSQEMLFVGRREESNISETHTLYIVEDPLNPGNNVARSCFRIQAVQSLFAEALASLLSFLVRSETIKNYDSHSLLEQVLLCK